MAEHTRQVSEGAATFAAPFGAQEEARLAGMLHDLGKYSERFDRRLHGLESGLDHWSAGAWTALKMFGCPAAALAIQGHHIGLERGDLDALRAMDPRSIVQFHPRLLQLTEPDCSLLQQRLSLDGFVPERPEAPLGLPLPRQTASAMLDTRMLFSALVDADYLDTEAHMRRPRRPGRTLDAARALQLLEGRIRQLTERADLTNEIQIIRSDLWKACRAAAAEKPGLFTLSAPTGAGKTLAMLGFALRHAVAHGLRRIVYVAPYLTIIDQNVDLFHQLFDAEMGEGYVLEHHSLAVAQNPAGSETDGVSAAELRRRELTENWDAPLIVTTSVQLLESLFANRPSTCRKLHRLCQSVILFDEVQTLPLSVTVPTLKTLSRLADPRYGSSILFATATQPAFHDLHARVLEPGANSGWQAREIVSPGLRLFERSRRVEVDWTNALQPIPWETLSQAIAQTEQSLCVVNLKRHAKNLADRLKGLPGTLHLSTSMCPAHREQTLNEVRQRLDNELPCRLISTQCVEAGVDLDFPVVHRAFADLVAIAQAAGRCNRNARWASGRVVVFLPEQHSPGETMYPDPAYERAARVTQSLLVERGALNIADPDLFLEFFRRLYGAAPPDQMNQPLREAIARQDYAEVARLYRLIVQPGLNILVPYAGELPLFERLAAEARQKGLSRGWIRRARPLAVNVFAGPNDPARAYLQPILTPAGEPSEDWFIYLEPAHYDSLVGLAPIQTSGLWMA